MITETVMSTEMFIANAKQVHGDKYNYDKANVVAKNRKVVILCPVHGEFMQTPNQHLSGRGCPNCSSMKTSAPKINDEFIADAIAIHGNKYNYDKVQYVGNHKKVTITCPEHGDFKQMPSNHLRGNGCPVCGIEKQSNKLRMSTETFITKAKEVHGDKYNYDKVHYTGTHTKVQITCPEHGDFFQSPSNHLRGTNCPVCSIKFRQRHPSKGDFIAKAKDVHAENRKKIDYKVDKNDIKTIDVSPKSDDSNK